MFGTYGMLAVALMLFSWRGLVQPRHWSDTVLKISFWGMNIGLFLMAFTTLLPVGVLQVWHSVATGFWYARSAAFYELPLVCKPSACGAWCRTRLSSSSVCCR
jgi:nitric oxide reductase subunit B